MSGYFMNRYVDKIKYTKLDSFFSFMLGAKSANSKLFKDFCNEAEMEKNIQMVDFILSSFLRVANFNFIVLPIVTRTLKPLKMKTQGWQIICFIVIIKSLFFMNNTSFAQAAICPALITNSPAVPCTSPCTTLSVTPTSYLATTTAYSLAPVTYSPFPYTGTNVLFLGVPWAAATDDTYSGSITLPFNFCFFGNTYNQIVVGTNGNISFNSGLAGGSDPWQITGPLPNSNCNATYNCIMAVWNDTYVGAGPITYASYGTAPCRKFVISYDSVDLYLPGSYCTGMTTTSQIVLYESSNIIDIYIGKRTACPAWNSGLAVCGIENNAGTLFYCPAGENGTTFSATNQGWRFTPNGAVGGWAYAWYEPGGATVATTPTVTVCTPATTTYTVVATSACSGVSISATATVTITGSVPFAGPPSICAGSSISLSDAITGGTWSSSNTSVATIGSSSGIVTGVSAGNATITYSQGGCDQTATIIVNPSPSAIIGVTNVCAGAAIILSDTPAGGTWSSSNTSVATVSGTGVVTGNIAGTATITYTIGGGLTGPGCIATASVTVNPAPAAILGATSVCAGATIFLSDPVVGGVWSSSNTAIATIILSGTAGGTVTGVAAGITIITYSLPAGCLRTATVTVRPLPSFIAGTMHACTGVTTALSDATGGGVWSSGASAIATIDSVTGLVTGVTVGVAAISYSKSGCMVTATITVDLEPSFNPGTPNICTDGTATLVATPGGGTWSSTNTTIATITSVSTDSAIVYGIDTGITIVTYSLSGCTTSRTITAVAILPPITGGPDVCTGQSILLSNAITGGTWSSGNTTIAIADAGTGTVTGVSPGVPVIIYSLGGSCVITTTITVNLSPDHGAITGPTNLCVGYTISLSDTVSSGVWGMSNGSAAITGTLVTGVSPGTDTVMYIVSNTLCTDTATKAITVYAVPDSGIISGLHVLCTGLTIILSDTASGGVWSSAVASIATVTPIAIGRGMVTGVSAGMDTIKYTVSNPGCATTASHVITVYDIPVPGIINGPAAVCIGTVFTLSDTASGGVWSSSNTLVATIDNNTDSLYTLNQGTTTIAYTIGPNPGGCIGVATFTLTVSVPLLVTVNSTVTDVTCNGDKNGSIKIGIDLSNIVVFYSWSNSDTGSLITGLDTGKYVLTITYGGTPCKSTDTFRITQPDSLLVTPVVENDICNEGRGSISLEVTGGTPSYSYLWSNNALGKAISGLAAEVYSVSVTDRNNCINILSVIVSDTCSAIMVHDVITPNGDGVNDIWVVEGIQNYLANTVQVFDKWGDLVYEKTNYSNDWDGKGKSGLLPDGTYYYLIKLNAKNGAGSKDTFTGTVLIKR